MRPCRFDVRSERGPEAFCLEHNRCHYLCEQHEYCSCARSTVPEAAPFSVSLKLYNWLFPDWAYKSPAFLASYKPTLPEWVH